MCTATWKQPGGWACKWYSQRNSEADKAAAVLWIITVWAKHKWAFLRATESGSSAMRAFPGEAKWIAFWKKHVSDREIVCTQQTL